MQPTCDHDIDVVDFDDILSAARIEPDDICDAPWDNCDGFDHAIERATSDDSDKRGHVYWDRGHHVITLDAKATKGDYEWYRRNGASKQVATEKLAQCKRERIVQLVKWYSDGWNCYYVQCDFAGELDSLGGIYDEDGAYVEECRVECAVNVAHALEARGIIVRGMPDRDDAHAAYRANRIEGMRRMLNAFNVSGR